MTKDILVMNGLILFYVIQRISEMFISKSNEEWLKSHHLAVEIDKKESMQMRLFHIGWFIALMTEANIRQSLQSPELSLVIYLMLAFCLVVRLHSINKLKHFWTIKVLSMKSPTIVTDGLYQYVRHPNYFIVIIELLLIPLLFKAYWTMTLFSLANLYILSRRIRAEENAMMGHTDYQAHFINKKRFLPYIFMLFFTIFPLHAYEMNIHASSYEEAKNNQNFLKFQSTSTKLGLITTSFDGYAKNFKVSYDEKGEVLSGLEVNLFVKSFDTDIKLRDEKIHTTIMEAEKFPILKAIFSGPIHLMPGDQNINMTFTIKDKNITRPVALHFIQKEGKWLITGKTQIGLQEMGLPDPSIAIAKVRDLFDIEFSLLLEK